MRSFLAILLAALTPSVLNSAAIAAAPVVIDAAPFVDRGRADCGLQRPIDLASSVGGGIVLVPAGTYELRCGLLLKDGVALTGAGIDRTVLMPARRPQRLEVVEDRLADGRIVLERLPARLEVGTAVVACEQFPPSSRNDPAPCIVKSVDREMRAITLEAPYGRPQLKPGTGCLIYGDSAALQASVVKGDWHVVLRSTRLFRPGDELTFGAPTNESLLAHAFVHAVDGNRLILRYPARSDFPLWPKEAALEGARVNALVWNVFPMIHGAHVRKAAIRDLTVRGHGLLPVCSTQNRWTVAGIHFFDAEELRIQRVAVRDWPSDGISLQTGDKCRVLSCEITGVLGSGLHPGTGLTNSVFSRNLVERCGAGLYFCWNNSGHVLRYNRFTHNKGGGITGLGNPLDQHNTVRNNYVAYNGTFGIEINGGGDAGNIIRDNIVENNSQAAPGKYPGIGIDSLGDGARQYTISGNTVRDTQRQPTQHVGIEEHAGGDGNTITGNRLSGHSTADVIPSGAKTVVQNPVPAVPRKKATAKKHGASRAPLPSGPSREGSVRGTAKKRSR